MSSANEFFVPSPLFGERSRVFSWIRKGTLALTDQGMISGSNFAISVLLARWFAADRYGAYALAFAVFLLVSQLHQALLLEPMSVYGSSSFRGKLRHYLGALLWMHGGTVALISVLLAAAGLGVFLTGHSVVLAGALFGVSLASPGILLFWLVRRSFYLELQPASATQGAVLYCALVLLLLRSANSFNLLSPFTAFLIMGMAALITSITFLRKLKPITQLSLNELSLSETSSLHWAYGRWALASSVAMWIPTNLYYVLLGTSSGMAHAGELRALMNLALPVGQTATALSLLFVPYAARARVEQGPQSLRKISLAITALFALGAIAYWAVVVMFRGSVVHLFYGGRYSEISTFVPLVAASSIFQTCINGPCIALRANEMPIYVFYTYLVSSVITVGGGIISTKLFGVEGAVVTMLVANVCAFLIAQLMLSRNARPVLVVSAEAA